MKKFLNSVILIMVACTILVFSGCGSDDGGYVPDKSRYVTYAIYSHYDNDNTYWVSDGLYDHFTKQEEIPYLEVGKDYYCELHFGPGSTTKHPDTIFFNYDAEYMEITPLPEIMGRVYLVRGLKATDLLEAEVYAWEKYPVDRPDNSIEMTRKMYFKFADAAQTES